MKILGYEVNKVSLPAIRKGSKQDLRNYINPVQMQRARQDLSSWIAALNEAELPYFPYRVKMQRLLNSTILNGHVFAAWDKRRDLTLLREFKLCNDQGTEDEVWTAYFKKMWFANFLTYAVDAIGFGYNLISLGDMVNSEFPNLGILPRHLVSPDRYIVSRFEYMPSGAPFLDAPLNNWHVYVSTPTELGVSACGYGLLYKVALYEIFARNNLSFNMDYNELFGQPTRVGKTSKTEEAERAEFAGALQNMGSMGWMMMDPMDEIELVETSGAGQGYKTFADMEVRVEKKISKLILGHADALDSVPGKLGSGQPAKGGEDGSPVAKALRDKQTKDGVFIENVIGNSLLPALRNLGIPIPPQLHFEFKNDAEVEEIRRKEDESNDVTAGIALKMTQAGLKMDAKYFTERTGIPCEEIEEPAPIPPTAEEGKQISDNIKNKLAKIYGHHH